MGGFDECVQVQVNTNVDIKHQEVAEDSHLFYINLINDHWKIKGQPLDLK